MSVPTLEQIEELCERHGWPRVGPDHDLMGWLDHMLGVAENTLSQTGELDMGLDEIVASRKALAGALSEALGRLERMRDHHKELGDELDNAIERCEDVL